MIEYYKNFSLENLFYIDKNGLVQEEEWKDIDNYKEEYSVSNLGRVKSEGRFISHFRGGLRFIKPKIVRQSINKKGYLCYAYPLIGTKRKSNKTTHRLVALAFIPNPKNKPQVNHKGELANKLNNCFWMLEWNTSKENIEHSWETGLNKSIRGEEYKNCRLTKQQVLEIRAIGRTKSQVEIALIYNVGHQSIAKILNYKTWKKLS